MGLFGLRRFIDASGCTYLLPVPLDEENNDDDVVVLNEEKEEEDNDDLDSKKRFSLPTADHVLIDLNCIVHSCFSHVSAASSEAHRDTGSTGKLSGSSIGTSSSERALHSASPAVNGIGQTKKEVIAAVLYRLEVLLTRVVAPVKSLTICLDGPPPLAKIQTQRLRRRKVSLMDSQASSSSSSELNALAITAGSLFMVELENEIAAVFKKRQGKGFLWNLCPVFLHGTTVMGEGESKISRALFHLAYGDAPPVVEGGTDHARNGFSPYALGYRNHGPPPYNPNDTVVVVGNDIDLVMTCLGSTFYHNISVLSPASLQVISVSDMLYRWVKASGNANAAAARITLEELPALRIDFMFLFLLNGGDHYTGAGDVAMGLWQRYKTVRSAALQSRSNRNRSKGGKSSDSRNRYSLVSSSLNELNVNILADVLQADDYSGEADAGVGIRLLQSALWSLYTTVTGVCPDYRYLPPQEDQPNLSHLRAAAAFCKRKKRSITFPFVRDSAPLSPLEHYVALMPTTAAMPKGVAATLHQPSLKKVAHVLLNSNDPKEIAAAAEKAIEASSVALRHSESYLRQFTSPVELNVLPPRKRLSRHEQHRLMAVANKQGGTSGKPSAQILRVEDPDPVVRVVYPPPVAEESTPVVSLQYPSSVKGFHFFSPFDKICGYGATSSQQDSILEKESSNQRGKSSREQELELPLDSRRYIPFGLWDTTSEGIVRGSRNLPEDEGGISAKLDHSLAIAERLEAKGHHGAAQGKKMRKKLWKAQAAVEQALREGASNDDWKYSIYSASSTHSTAARAVETISPDKIHNKKSGRVPTYDTSHSMDDFQNVLSSFLGDQSAVQAVLQDSKSENEPRRPPVAAPEEKRQNKTISPLTPQKLRDGKRCRSALSSREKKKRRKQ